MVAVTSSKFVGGPAFSGMLLIPEPMALRLKHRTLPRLPELGHAAMWPSGFSAQYACSGRPAFGLLARWEAALFEMDRFFAFSEETLTDRTRRLCQAFQERLAASALLNPLPTAHMLRDHDCWDSIATILPFTPITAYSDLQGVQIGQPVRIGDEQALRLCLSMPLIARAATDEEGMRAVLSDGEAAITAIENATLRLASETRAG
jgi:hypothetical protein